MVSIKKIFKGILLSFLFAYYVGEYGLQGQRPKNFNLSAEDQNLVTKKRDLLVNGVLVDSGYSTKNYINFEKTQLSSMFQKFRFKKFDHFTFIMASRYVVNFSISNLTYLYALNLSVSDINQKTNKKFAFENYPLISKEPNVNFNPNDCQSYSIQNGKNQVKVNKIKKNNVCQMEIQLKTEIIKGTIKFDINLDNQTPHEFNQVNESGSNWYYFIKHLNIEGESTLEFQEQKLNNQKTLVLLDYGRGIFNYKTEWYWATGSGRLANGKLFSFNFQEGLFDQSSKSCEDYFKVGDKLIKLNPLQQQVDYENQTVLIKTHQKFLNEVGRIAEIEFKPIVKTQLGKSYGVLKATLEYTYGFYSGWVSNEQGTRIQFQNILGLYEHPIFKW